MNYKDKAKELVNKYFNEIVFSEFVDDLDASKQCAIIACDSIIEAMVDDWSHLDYWQQVKQAINEL